MTLVAERHPEIIAVIARLEAARAAAQDEVAQLKAGATDDYLARVKTLGDRLMGFDQEVQHYAWILGAERQRDAAGIVSTHAEIAKAAEGVSEEIARMIHRLAAYRASTREAAHGGTTRPRDPSPIVIADIERQIADAKEKSRAWAELLRVEKCRTNIRAELEAEQAQAAAQVFQIEVDRRVKAREEKSHE